MIPGAADRRKVEFPRRDPRQEKRAFLRPSLTEGNRPLFAFGIAVAPRSTGPGKALRAEKSLPPTQITLAAQTPHLDTVCVNQGWTGQIGICIFRSAIYKSAHSAAREPVDGPAARVVRRNKAFMRHLVIVSALVILAAVVQAVVVGRAVVPALDSGRFLVTAQAIDRDGLVATLRNRAEQPMFSVAVWGVRRSLRAVWGDFPSLGAASVQLAAALPLVILAVPVYFLSLRMYGPRAAMAGAGFFAVLPEVARLGADGISDSTHLLFFALALWAVVAFVTGRDARGAMADFRNPSPDSGAADAARWGSPWLLLVAGLATGAAALVRSEVLTLPVALAAGATLTLLFRDGRRAIVRLGVGSACYLGGLAVVLVPYLALCGALSPEAAVGRLRGRPGPEAARSVITMSVISPPAWQLPDGQPMCFAAKDAATTRHRGLGASLRLLGGELCEAYWYWVGLLGIYALWVVRRLRARPADWFVRLFLLVYCVAAAGFAAREGYLCARHLLPLVIVGVGCCGFGAIEAGRALSLRTGFGTGPALAVLIAGAACLGQTLLPVGRCAAAHREAAAWLAAQPGAGTVVDTRGWSRLYSGRRTFQYADGPAAFADPELAYVVVEPWELRAESPRSRTLCWLLSKAGQRAAVFVEPQGGHSQGVVVYRWQPERLRRQPAGGSIATDAQRVHDAQTSASLCSERRRGV